MPKVTPNEIHDYGLVAYLRLQGYEVIKDEKKLHYSVRLQPEELSIVATHYFEHLKPVLDGIRRIKKELVSPKT